MHACRRHTLNPGTPPHPKPTRSACDDLHLSTTRMAASIPAQRDTHTHMYTHKHTLAHAAAPVGSPTNSLPYKSPHKLSV